VNQKNFQQEKSEKQVARFEKLWIWERAHRLMQKGSKRDKK
jgi:hypothetical protein